MKLRSLSRRYCRRSIDDRYVIHDFDDQRISYVIDNIRTWSSAERDIAEVGRLRSARWQRRLDRRWGRLRRGILYKSWRNDSVTCLWNWRAVAVVLLLRR